MAPRGGGAKALLARASLFGGAIFCGEGGGGQGPLGPPLDPRMTQDVDESLTNLDWLLNLNINVKITTPTTPAWREPQAVSFQSTSSTTKVLTNCANPHRPTGAIPSSQTRCISKGPVESRQNPHTKPPYTYTTLICMALRESKKDKVTLSRIYTWITENFPYYKSAEPSWRNSIRHNLSLNKCFLKIARRPDEPGKGGFWCLNPEYADMFVDGIYQARRKAPWDVIIAPAMKRSKSEDTEEVLIGGVCTVNPNLSSDIRQEVLGGEVGTVLHMDDDNIESVLHGDFNFNSALHQDIQVDGVSIKTEDILDEGPAPVADAFSYSMLGLSPPHSDSGSDFAIEEFLIVGDLASKPGGNDDLGLDALDLTTYKAGESTDRGTTNTEGDMFPDYKSGLNTPLASPVEDQIHQWGQSDAFFDEKMSSFSLDVQDVWGVDLSDSGLISCA